MLCFAEEQEEKGLLIDLSHEKVVVYTGRSLKGDCVSTPAIEKLQGDPFVLEFDRRESIASGKKIYKPVGKSLEGPRPLFIGRFCQQVFFCDPVTLPERAYPFVFLDSTRKIVKTKDGFVLRVFCTASTTDVDIFKEVN